MSSQDFSSSASVDSLERRDDVAFKSGGFPIIPVVIIGAAICVMGGKSFGLRMPNWGLGEPIPATSPIGVGNPGKRGYPEPKKVDASKPRSAGIVPMPTPARLTQTALAPKNLSAASGPNNPSGGNEFKPIKAAGSGNKKSVPTEPPQNSSDNSHLDEPSSNDDHGKAAPPKAGRTVRIWQPFVNQAIQLWTDRGGPYEARFVGKSSEHLEVSYYVGKVIHMQYPLAKVAGVQADSTIYVVRDGEFVHAMTTYLFDPIKHLFVRESIESTDLDRSRIARFQDSFTRVPGRVWRDPKGNGIDRIGVFQRSEPATLDPEWVGPITTMDRPNPWSERQFDFDLASGRFHSSTIGDIGLQRRQDFSERRLRDRLLLEKLNGADVPWEHVLPPTMMKPRTTTSKSN